MFDFVCKLFIKDFDKEDSKKTREHYGTFAGFIGIGVNLLLSLIKLVAGLLSFSISIMADALNNLSDAGASIVSVVSFKLSAKPADRKHPFGHARMEYIASMIVSFLILIVGVDTLKSAITSAVNVAKGVTENKTDVTAITVTILSISIVMKIALAMFYRFVAKKIDSTVMKASAADSISDAISTAVVLAASVIIKFTGWYIVDSIMASAVSVLIIVAGLKILNETKNSLLGDAPVDTVVDDIKKIVAECKYIIDIHDLAVHNYGPSHYVASFHAEVDGKGDIFVLHDAIDNVEKRINEELGILCTIHLDPIATDDEIIKYYKEFVIETVNKLDLGVSIHDFRVVVGETHTNLIFDMVVPFEVKDPNAVIDRVKNEIHATRSECYAVITTDRC